METVLENFMAELGRPAHPRPNQLQFLEEGGISRDEADRAEPGAGNRRGPIE